MICKDITKAAASIAIVIPLCSTMKTLPNTILDRRAKAPLTISTGFTADRNTAGRQPDRIPVRSTNRTAAAMPPAEYSKDISKSACNKFPATGYRP